MLTYTVTIIPAEEGGFNVFVPTLPGCQTQAETYDEAIQAAKECVEGYLEALAIAGELLPVEPQPNTPQAVGIQVNVPARW
jgi:predicted RNase H-like HicB family nuclease